MLQNIGLLYLVVERVPNIGQGQIEQGFSYASIFVKLLYEKVLFKTCLLKTPIFRLIPGICIPIYSTTKRGTLQTFKK